MRRALTETVGLESPFHSSLLISPRLAAARSDISRQYRSHYVLMGITDTLAVFLAMVLAYQLRFDRLLPTVDFWLLLLTVPLITPVVYLTMRLYRVHQYSTAEEFRRIIVAISLIISATVMVSFWSKASFSRLWMLLSWGLGLVLALTVRRLWHWRVRRIRLEGKLTSPGPVVFRQERVGLRGRPFTLLKFRTMVVGADQLLEDLRERNEADGPLFKLRQDPRVTRVGAVLRRYSIDELPQLWNVLKGEMSLVGPRPPLAGEVALYEEWQHDRLEVRPGITGLWQVSGRSELTFEDYVRLDLFYVENWSIAYDLFILSKTVPLLVSARGAY